VVHVFKLFQPDFSGIGDSHHYSPSSEALHPITDHFGAMTVRYGA
jgi:hypothetical protein